MAHRSPAPPEWSRVTLYLEFLGKVSQATNGSKPLEDASSGIHIAAETCLIRSTMMHAPNLANLRADRLDMPGLMTVLAHASARPRYAFMVLNLIAEVARPDGSAGPLVTLMDGHMPLRDWLCDALSPMGHRDPRRIALADRVRADLEETGLLPKSPGEADRIIDEEVRNRVRTASKSNLSRAVSELVRAGLLDRHYQGYQVDHHDRGLNVRRSTRSRQQHAACCGRGLDRPCRHALPGNKSSRSDPRGGSGVQQKHDSHLGFSPSPSALSTVKPHCLRRRARNGDLLAIRVNASRSDTPISGAS